MKTPLARSNLLHQKARTAVGVAGVAFALLLIFMQLGFHGSAEATATLLYDQLDFDLLLVSCEYVEVNHAGTFPRRRLGQAEANPAVAGAAPVYVGIHLWRNPDPASRRRRNIMVVGFRPDDRVFRLAEVEQARAALKEPDTVLFDRRSRHEFGPPAGPSGAPLQTEVGTKRITVVGRFTLGTGFGADGLLLTGDETFTRIFAGRPPDAVSLGLLRLRPGADVERVAGELRRTLPADVRVRTRAEIADRERRHWVANTSVGTIFRFGVAVALVVGVVFVYQVISSDIGGRLHEYATLKAMGHTESALGRVVLHQAVLLAVLGYVPGLLASLGLYEATRRLAGIPIGMTWERAVAVLALAVAMCGVSGLLALRQVRAADPADLF
jgi:putative ABC transport system permease protein